MTSWSNNFLVKWLLSHAVKSNVHSDLYSEMEMTQLCFVSTSLGAQVLILSEFIMFYNNS